MIDWAGLQAEHKEWEDKNFPNDDPDSDLDHSLLGVIEEMGELAHAHLKEAQNIRGEAKLHQAEAQDAVGDITIYLLGVMHKLGVEELNERVFETGSSSTECLKRLVTSVGLLVDKQPLTGRHPTLIEAIVAHLAGYCEHRGWSYEAIVLDTWAQVKQRDWVANPEDGSQLANA